jgi:hypothetical protein
MNVRELLQIELWSKRTSRKIFVGVVVVCGLFFVGGLVWNQISLHWLTPGERSAARLALRQIEALKDDSSLSGLELEAQAEQVQAQVKAAGDAAKTYRDHFVEMQLDSFFVSVMWERRKIEREHSAKQGYPFSGKPDGEHEEKIDAFMKSWSLTDRLALHKELD